MFTCFLYRAIFSKLWFCIHFLVKSSSFHSKSILNAWKRFLSRWMNPNLFWPTFCGKFDPFWLTKAIRSNRSNVELEQFLLLYQINWAAKYIHKYVSCRKALHTSGVRLSSFSEQRVKFLPSLNGPLLTLLCCPPPSRIYTQMSSWNFSKMLLNPGDDC